MTPLLASDRLDWASAIGLFLINYGALDWLILTFLKKRLPPDQFTQIKDRHFQDRIARVKSLVGNGRFSVEDQRAFAKFFARLEPIRELRNHVAHGHLLLSLPQDSKTALLTLSLPKDLSAGCAPPIRRLDFPEMTSALSELTSLIEDFQTLTGDWSSNPRIGANPEAPSMQ